MKLGIVNLFYTIGSSGCRRFSVTSCVSVGGIGPRWSSCTSSIAHTTSWFRPLNRIPNLICHICSVCKNSQLQNNEHTPVNEKIPRWKLTRLN